MLQAVILFHVNVDPGVDFSGPDHRSGHGRHVFVHSHFTSFFLVGHLYPHKDEIFNRLALLIWWYFLNCSKRNRIAFLQHSICFKMQCTCYFNSLSLLFQLFSGFMSFHWFCCFAIQLLTF